MAVWHVPPHGYDEILPGQGPEAGARLRRPVPGQGPVRKLSYGPRSRQSIHHRRPAVSGRYWFGGLACDLVVRYPINAEQPEFSRNPVVRNPGRWHHLPGATDTHAALLAVP